MLTWRTEFITNALIAASGSDAMKGIKEITEAIREAWKHQSDGIIVLPPGVKYTPLAPDKEKQAPKLTWPEGAEL